MSMSEIPWYTDASLVSQKRIFCVGSLAQCLRKWLRLPEIEQQSTHIELGIETLRRKRIEREEIMTLASNPDLMRV